MNRIMLIFLLTVSGTTVFSQAYKDDVKTRFNEYTNALIKKNYAQAVEYMNPEIFNMIPKDQMAKVLEMTFNNPDFDFEIGKMDILSIGDKKTFNGQDFVKVLYSNVIKMRFHPKDGKVPDTATAKKNLSSMFGQGSVNYNAQTKYYTIQAKKNVVANAPKGKKWTFIVIEERQRPILEQFIPKEMMD